MSKFPALVIAAYAYLPIVIVVLSSLSTGLTEYPKASGWVTNLKILINMLSVLTHRDSPGTLKRPFVMSEEPDGTLRFERLP